MYTYLVHCPVCYCGRKCVQNFWCHTGEQNEYTSLCLSNVVH